MRVWRNWQTRKIQVLVEATLYRFKSCYPHHGAAFESGNKNAEKPCVSRVFGVF